MMFGDFLIAPFRANVDNEMAVGVVGVQADRLGTSRKSTGLSHLPWISCEYANPMWRL
jgi:hypothetical protein